MFKWTIGWIWCYGILKTSIMAKDTSDCDIVIKPLSPPGPVVVQDHGFGSIEFEFIANKRYTVQWFDPNNQLIRNSSRFHTFTLELLKIAHLTITEPVSQDSGKYKIMISSSQCNSVEYFNLTVLQAPFGPSIAISSRFVKPHKEVTFICIVTGYPESYITFFFIPCSPNGLTKFPDEKLCKSQMRLKGKFQVSKITELIQNATLSFTPTDPGRVICAASNEVSDEQCSGLLYIQKYDKPMVLQATRDQISDGDTVSLICYASMYNFTNSLDFQRNGSNVKQEHLAQKRTSKVSMTDSIDDYMYVQNLTIHNITSEDAGVYQCLALGIDQNTKSLSVTIEVKGAVAAHFDENTLLRQNVPVEKNSPLELFCKPRGMPLPTVKWFKNDNQLYPNDLLLIEPTRLFVDHVESTDAGQYECEATNLLGSASIHYDVNIISSSPISALAFGISLMLIFVLITISVIAFVMYRREHRKRLESRDCPDASVPELNLEGAVVLNSKMTVSEQADLLPYDTNYDFKMADLKLGMRLGVGAFGEVLMAEATNILSTEPKTTVAVKRVKNNADIQTLIMETKIMMHLGHHLNVVSLLGVVRENLEKRELFVITEYCEEGNLYDFVKRNRHNFVNQINPLTNEIDTRIMKETPSKITGFQPAVKLLSLSLNKSAACLRVVDQKKTEPTPSKFGHISNDKVTTTDLVCWSFQVAQGMHYLARRGVLHGDLAARNLLLTKDGVVKICDFGLSRTMLPEEDYKKKSPTALPLRWMAIESIERRIFNTSSDVWSFGIMMWELFSMGAVPYVNVKDHALLDHLLRGYRLEQPQFCSKAIYANMLDCWKVIPTNRPRFSTLVERLANFLGDEHLERFNDRTAKYVEINLDQDHRYRYFSKIVHPDSKAPGHEGCDI